MTVSDITSPDSARSSESGPASTPSEWGAHLVNLDAYFRRTGYTGPRTADLAALTALHRAHLESIAFENVDVALGRGISLELPDVQGKLVDAGRGGYCFEHNLLFAAVLEQLGFPVTRLLARVRRGRPGVRYRAHATLVVQAEYRLWLCDVGFGDDGLIAPVPLESGAESTVDGWTWRTVRQGDEWVLQAARPDGWFDLYAFRTERHFPPDFEVSNFFTAHHESSTFTGRTVAMRYSDRMWHVLNDHRLVRHHADGRTEHTELNADRIIAELRGTFGLRLDDEDAHGLRRRHADA
jgi:N-hydroxyarylamine O-acetyltransferase